MRTRLTSQLNYQPCFRCISPLYLDSGMIHLEPAVLKLASLVKYMKEEDLENVAHILNQLALALRMGRSGL
jgi:hypothetical protein